MTICRFLLLFLFCEALNAGDLEWEQTTIALDAKAGDKQVEASFAFTNTTSTPVEIGRIRTSCGCTTTEMARKVYQPGESGLVKVVFNLGGRKGLQEKSVIVPTGKSAQDILLLRVNIPDSLTVNKETLSWEVGDPLDPQSFEVTVLEPGITKIKAARAIGNAFTAELREMEAGKTYEVTVTPLDTEKPKRGTIRLDVADPGNRSMYLKVEVKP